MAFPSASVIDDANRSDEGPPPSSDYTSTPTYFSGIEVDSNEFAPSGTNSIAIWDTAFADDQDAFITISTVPTNGESAYVCARLEGVGSALTITGYFVDALKAGGTDSIRIRRFNGNGTGTTLATYSQEFSAGDKIGIRCHGSTIEAWYDDGTGWTMLGSTTDANYSAGRSGFGATSTTVRLDDFAAGDAEIFQPAWAQHAINQRTIT